VIDQPALARADVPRLGFLSNADASQDRIDALKDGMRALGYVEGTTVWIEWRFADATNANFQQLARDLAALPVDILFAGNAPAAVAAHRVTTTMPIIITAVNDPVGLGIVASLEHPGGNVTGMTIFAPQLIARRLQSTEARLQGPALGVRRRRCP
jgi:putative ABC transport system substrate-binding protein